MHLSSWYPGPSAGRFGLGEGREPIEARQPPERMIGRNSASGGFPPNGEHDMAHSLACVQV